jgi:hypothetical protein
MRIKLVVAVVAFAVFHTVLLPAQDKPEGKPLENKDIVQMVQNHFDDDTLLTIIEVNDTHFDVSPSALIELKKAGVSDRIIRAMLASPERKRSSASATGSATPATAASANSTGASNNQAATTAPSSAVASNAGAGMPSNMGVKMSPQQAAQMQSMQPMLAAMGLGNIMGMGMPSADPAHMPHVFLMGPPAKQEISPSTAQIAQTKFKGGGPSPGGMMLRSLATEGLSFAAMSAGPAGMMAMSGFSVASGFMPGMRPGTPSMTYVWGLPGLHSSRILPADSLAFELSYGDIPGVDPDGYEPALVQLVQTKDNYRLVGATRSKMGRNTMMGGGPEEGKWISEERVPVRLNKEERGFYVLHVDQPLEPGEYAVVFRPVKGHKPVSSGFSSAAQVFYSVWDFRVPGTPADDTTKKKKKK